jgi:hypothetical protein
MRVASMLSAQENEEDDIFMLDIGASLCCSEYCNGARLLEKGNLIVQVACGDYSFLFLLMFRP